MEKRTAVSIAVFSVISLGFLAVGVHVGLNAEQWAAWIQAIGSIGAILAAVGVVQYQRRNEIRLAAERERLSFQRKMYAMRALFMEIAQRCHTVAGKVHGDHITWELEKIHLQEARAMLTALPVFDIPDSGLVMRIMTIVTGLRTAEAMAEAMKTPRSKSVRDNVTSILLVPHDQCLEAIVEVTNQLARCSTEKELELAWQSFERFKGNMQLAKQVMASQQQKSKSEPSDSVIKEPSDKQNVS